MCSDQTKDSDLLTVHICQNVNRWAFLTVTIIFKTTLASKLLWLETQTHVEKKRLLDSTFKIQTVAYLMLNWIHSAMTDSIIRVTQFITQLISLEWLKRVKRLARWPEDIWSTVYLIISCVHCTRPKNLIASDCFSNRCVHDNKELELDTNEVQELALMYIKL